MHCSNCDRDSEDGTRVCPWCGARASPATCSRSKGRKAILAVAVAIVIVAACFILFSDSDNRSMSIDPRDSSDDSGIPVYTVPGTVDDLSISYTTGNPDIFEVSYAEDDAGNPQIIVTMDDSEASKYSTFTWYVNKTAGSGNSRVGSITKTVDKNDDANKVTWTLGDDDVGTYTIGVVCSKEGHSGGSMNFGPWFLWDQTKYALDFTIDGKVSKTYSWEYGGSNYSFTIDYQYSEYGKYAGTNGATMEKRKAYNDGKDNVDFSVITDFIVVNDVIDGIQNALKNAYESSGNTASGQGYAEFILAFVQECYGYMYDEVQYAQDEYFAFPMETIYNGYGDCEDTSILLAAIYESAGYDAGVFLIPGHAIAAIALDPYVAGEYDTAQKVSVFGLTQDGRTYYGCETTLKTNSYGVGYISDEYTIEDGIIYYNGEKVSDQYGLYTIGTTA